MPRAVADLVFGVLTFIGVGIFMLAIDALTVGVVVGVTTVAFAGGESVSVTDPTRLPGPPRRAG